MPGLFELKPTLAKIWHAPDNFRIMDPLPTMHRRGIIIAALLVVVGFLLPSGDDGSDVQQQVSRNAQLDIQSQSRPHPEPTQLVTPTNDPGQVAPVEPEPVQEEQPQEQAAAPVESQAQQATGIEQQWRSYRVESGKTMAQLFHDNNLPPTDVYSMAQVEGAGKPLSNLQNGQMVQIRQNASGVVTGLTIDTGNNQQVFFTCLFDGSFVRAR